MLLIPSKLSPSLSRWSVTRLLLTLCVGFVLWIIVAIACSSVGSTGEIRWPDLTAIGSFRIQMVLLSSLIGACLAAAGVVYQAVLRNALADPYLLGVSSGASLWAYLWRFPLFASVGLIGAMSQQAFAFAGAISVVAIVLMLATQRGRLEPLTLLLVGVILNAINGAIFLLLHTLYPAMTAGIGGEMSFLIGGIQTNLQASQIGTAAVIACLGWLVLMSIAGHLNVATLHEAEAQSLGVRIHRLRWVALVVASIITAAVVSISGPIGFVGLICPHVARRVFGADQRQLLPWSTALGACLLCAADAVSRLLTQVAGTHLPVGVLTALLGGPFFLVLLWENRRGRNAEF